MTVIRSEATKFPTVSRTPTVSNATARSCVPTTDPCVRCDLLLGLDDVHVKHVVRGPATLRVTVSTRWQLMGCPACGVVAVGRGRRLRRLSDVPGEVAVTIRRRQRTWRCHDTDCSVGIFVEQYPALVAPRGSLTVRAVTCAIGQLRREHATIAGLARQRARCLSNAPCTRMASCPRSATSDSRQVSTQTGGTTQCPGLGLLVNRSASSAAT